MEREILLSPEELFYLGSLLQAKYIDYAYVAAMGDIKQNHELFEKETKAALVSAGILLEDFSGNLELDDTVRKLLTPVFFGETETSVTVCKTGEIKAVSAHMFHFHDGIITAVKSQEGKFLLSFTDQFGIQKLVTSLVPAGYNAESGNAIEVDPNQVDRLIVFKLANLSAGSAVRTYADIDGVLYVEADNKLVSINAEDFVADGLQIVKGV